MYFILTNSMDYMYFCMRFHVDHSYSATCQLNPCQTRYELFIDLYIYVTDSIWSANSMEYMYFCMLFLVVQSGFMHRSSCLCYIDKPYICI